ncbi:uncharacterized protein LOC133926746 isoform X2 [Phragmites australis]|uniref:uncharacterized protein LOC133926746 isoform X2 n=1 Tax=Phragmites australis TaxID=29695 RepID=UPI002D797D35|nr:uncharacterized protein LOC133926746 isoform X2 [Phragmites australis]
MGIGRKRRRVGGELSRVAEIVMVLAAAGQARSGRAPTAAERALAAEVRGTLVAAVEEVAWPRELFQREAVSALVEDLGLTHARDPAAVGYRPRRASIADRVVLTKRKMEEVKEALVHSTTNVPKTTISSGKTGFQLGASKSTTGSPRNLSNPMTSPFILKQPLLNGTVAGASSVKPANIPSIVSLPPVGPADIKVEKGLNGSNFTQSGAITDQAKSEHHTATSSDQNFIQSSSPAGKSLDKNAPAIHPVTGSFVTGHQAPSGDLSVKKQSVFSNHKVIAENIERIVNKHVIHPSWAVPSTEYMNTQLNCQICKISIADMEGLLVCDACERGMHLKCLQHYEDQGLPKVEWYCPTCVAHSRGKPLPPKYGKVTRTIVAPKTSMISGVTQPYLQVAAENPAKKDGKQVAANEGVNNQNSNKVGSAVHKSGTLALDTSSKSLSISAAGPQNENVKHDETSYIKKERNSQPCGGILTESAKSCNEGQSSGASTYGSGNLPGQSHIDSSMNSVNNSTLQSTTLSGLEHLDHSPIVSSVENCESAGNSYQHPSKQMASTRTDETHQADEVAKNGIRKPLEQQIMADDSISDYGNAHLVTSNGHICPEHEIIGDLMGEYVGCSTASVVDWVGDALKTVDNKTYYNSCNIEGIIYNLNDHILIASEGSKSVPCKLQSLWEEHDSGSRLAMVNPYFFGSDAPESVSKPCTDEENEVYGSNNQRILLVSAICGPCDVVNVDEFREETKRCQLDNSDGSMMNPRAVSIKTIMLIVRWVSDILFLEKLYM